MIDYLFPRVYNLNSVLKTIPLLLLLLNPLWAAPSAESTFVLENGMRVIMSPVPDRQAVVILCYYSTGALDDPPGYSGFSSFYGSMHGLFTTENQKSYYSYRRLTENGGYTQHHITHDSCYFLQVAAEEELNNALWSESENIFLLSPTKAELNSLTAFSVDYARRFGPENTLFNARMWMFSQLFLSHPGYASSLIGNPTQIAAWTDGEIVKQIRRFMDPTRVILVVTGAFDPLLAQDSIQKYFEVTGTAEASAYPQTGPSQASKSAPIRKRSWWRDGLDRHYLLVGYRLPGMVGAAKSSNEEYFISRALFHYLTNPEIDHLGHMINQVNHLKVSVGAEITRNIHENALLISLASADRTSLEKARLIISGELESLANRKLSLQQMKSLRATLKTNFFKKMANLDERAIEIARTFHLFGLINPEEQFNRDLDKLEQNAIIKVVRKYFGADKQTLLYVYKKE